LCRTHRDGVLRQLVVTENAQGETLAAARRARHERAIEKQPLAAAELAHRAGSAERGRCARIAVLQAIGARIKGVGNQSDRGSQGADHAQSGASPEKISQKHETLLHR
jgi:hypothetical protein